MSISLNGSMAWITTNLYHALVYLQASFPEKYFWIDALCIDQSSPDERNHQVAQMKTIFSGAREVIAWLGPEQYDVWRLFALIVDHNKGCRDASSALASFSQDDPDTKDTSNDSDTEDTGKHRSKGRGCSQRLDPGVMSAVQHLESLPSWDRVWIIQEIVVGRKVRLVCGNDLISWSDFTTFFVCCPETISCTTPNTVLDTTKQSTVTGRLSCD